MCRIFCVLEAVGLGRGDAQDVDDRLEDLLRLDHLIETKKVIRIYTEYTRNTRNPQSGWGGVQLGDCQDIDGRLADLLGLDHLINTESTLRIGACPEDRGSDLGFGCDGTDTQI